MKIAVIAILFLAFASSCNDNTHNESKPLATEKSDLSRIKLFSLKGEPIDLAKYKGKAIFLNFWATWCRPCVEEMPTIKNAIESLKDQDIQFLFASDETKDEVDAFEREHDFGFTYLKAKDLQEFGILALPTTMIFDKEGKKIFSELGYRKWDDKENLDRLLQVAK